MAQVVVSSEGHILLPADRRRRLGLGAGAKLEGVETPDSLTLRRIRRVDSFDVAGLAGMAKAPSRGRPRSLDDFDPAKALGDRGRPNQENLNKIIYL